jgi:nucleoside-diphosphate-sugar epimerase
MAAQTRAIVAAMRETGIQRLIFVSTMGIYGKFPGRPIAAFSIPTGIREASDLNYTVLRPG